jgi:coenzyme F420-reducing hydrogenase delta subunit
MENAGKDGFRLAAGTTVMPVKCTGLVKVSFLLKMFAKGIDGVLVLGCLEEDCRYFNGSKRCAEIIEETREILELAGVDSGRLGFHLISESQGKEFKRVFTNYMKQFKRKAPKRRKRVAAAGN